jgi:hypothetical protein
MAFVSVASMMRAAMVPRKQKWCRSALNWTDSLASMDRHEME